MHDLLLAFMYSCPLWTPLIFGAYALGKKQFGVAFLFALLTAEAVSFVPFWLARFFLAINSAQLGGGAP
jgi:hypothetical protein